jgi:ribose 5-phosphate isomerase B
MKIAIASDHAGFEAKQALVQHLKAKGHQVEDLGPGDAQPSDYPLFAEKVGKAVVDGRAEKGIVVCGNGIGMSIAANKVPGVRAALVFSEAMAKQTRDHNDSNVLSLAGRELPLETNLRIAEAWLSTPFSRVERHARRVGEIADIEKKYLKGNS